MARKDSKGRNLRTGESQRKDGRYDYRYTDRLTGKRHTIYAEDLPELREKERQIQRDLEDGILTGVDMKNLTVNSLFERYMSISQVEEATMANYRGLWKRHVQDTLGNMKVVQVKPSHVRAVYVQMSKQNYARSTIKLVNTILYPMFEQAVQDDMIRKNPVKFDKDYGKDPEKRKALTVEQQERLFAFMEGSNTYRKHIPLLTIMIGTACRCGEIIGLTWSDVDFDEERITIDHQLIYKNYGDGWKFHWKEPKTEAGIRTIPMTKELKQAFHEQKKLQFALGTGFGEEVEGHSGFVFTTHKGRPMMPSDVNSALYHIVDACNEDEEKKAKKEKRKPLLVPHISAHVLRHTGCTRLSEKGMDPKVLQYLMGHSNIAVTMDVYNHIADMNRVEEEVKRVEGAM